MHTFSRTMAEALPWTPLGELAALPRPIGPRSTLRTHHCEITFLLPELNSTELITFSTAVLLFSTLSCYVPPKSLNTIMTYFNKNLTITQINHGRTLTEGCFVTHHVY